MVVVLIFIEIVINLVLKVFFLQFRVPIELGLNNVEEMDRKIVLTIRDLQMP